MGYYIQAIIGNQTLLGIATKKFVAAMVCPLAKGFALIPITDEFLDEIGAAGDSQRFEKFTPAVSQWLQHLSLSGSVAYVEAEYFGGLGGQGATVWSHGIQLLSPTHNSEAINIALRFLGVTRGDSYDEFEAIGLPRHRDTDDWLKEALPK